MSQFVEVPPLDMVKELFQITTGLQFRLDVSWTSWKPLDPADLYVFRPYIRKCHQKILMETANGVHPDVCSFLRQLLRPHGFCIKLNKITYVVCEKKEEEAHTVGKRAGATVVWEG